MIIEYIRYKVEPARAAAFFAAYEAASVQMKASPHCLGYELAQCTDAKEHYILRIQWDSHEGHLKGFRTSDVFKAFFAEGSTVREGHRGDAALRSHIAELVALTSDAKRRPRSRERHQQRRPLGATARRRRDRHRYGGRWTWLGTMKSAEDGRAVSVCGDARSDSSARSRPRYAQLSVASR